MKLFKLLLVLMVGAFFASGAAGQSNASLNILTLNSGQVAQGGVVDIQVTVGNTGPSASIGVNKVRAQISVPGALVNTLPNVQQTGLPPGWTITVNSGTAITVCNGTDVIPVGAQRQIFIKVQGNNIGGPSTVNGSLLFSSGTSCTVPGTLAGDNTADNTATTSIQVIDAPACNIGVSASAGSILCNGGSTTLTATATGTAAAVEYSIDGTNFQSSNTFTVGAGTYTVTAREAGNTSCSATSSSVIVSQPAAISVSASAGSAIQCFGGTTTFTATASGGTGSLEYSLNGGAFQAGNTFTVGGGTHTVTVRDANGCTVDASPVIVSQPGQVAVTAVVTTPIAVPGGTGTITVSASGGTGNKTYVITSGPTINTTGETSGVFTGLTAGSYVFTATDENGCTGSASQALNNPTAGPANASLNILTLNSGQVNVGDVVDVQVTVGNTGPSFIAANKVRAQISVPASIVATLPNAGQTGLPPGWTITVNNGSTITICNGSDVIPAGAQRQVFIKLQGNTAGGPSTINGSLLFSNGTSCTVPGTLNGDQTADNTATTSVQVIGAACNLSVSASAGTILCNGGSATLTATASGAAGAVEYSIDGTNFQSENTFTVGAGTYTVTAREVAAPACTATSGAVIVSQPSAISASASAGSAIQCFGGTTTLTVTAAGSTGSLEYSLNGGAFQAGNTFTVGTGTHTVTVRDANGCTVDASPVTVSQPGQVSVTAIVTTPIAVPGGTGTITVSASGGTGSKTYVITSGPVINTTGATSGVFTDLTAGSYVFTATDENSCTGSASISLNNPTPGPANASLNILTLSSGQVQVGDVVDVQVTVGNTGPSFIAANKVRAQISIPTSIASALPNVSQTGLPPGWTITANTGGTITVCNGSDVIPSGAQRQIFIKVQGNAVGGPSTINGSLLFSNGTSCTVPGTLNGDQTADNTATTSIQVTPGACTLAVSASAGSILCNGGTTTLTATATGAAGAVEYSIDGTNFQPGNTFTVSAGTYTVTAREVAAPSCTATSSAVTVSQPAELVAAESHTAILCFGGSSTVTITATGGTAPYTGTGTFTQAAGTQTYTVTDANGCTDVVTVIVSQPFELVAAESHTAILCFGGSSTVTITATGGTAPYTGTGTFTQTAGTQTYTVTDANGCTNEVTVTVSQPAQLAASATSTSTTTVGGTDGTATVVAAGGTAPYTYVWSPGGQTTATASGLTAGNYTVTVTDANGCTATASTTVGSPACNIAVTASAGTISCFGGTTILTATATGAAGAVEYSLNGGAFQADNTFTAGAGTYTISVREVANPSCSATSNSVTVSQPTQLTASTTQGAAILCNGGTTTITVTASDGTAPYTGTGTFTVGAGTFTYTVTDANGCTVTTAPVTVSQPGQVSLTVTVQASIPVPGGTGTIRVSASGGIGTKTYAIASGPVVNNTGATSGVFTDLTAGNYVFTATDENNCTGSASFTLNDPAPGLTNASLNILTLNSGQVTVGDVVDIQVTVGNTGSSFIGVNKVRAQISVPVSIATILPNAQQTGLPSGWTITVNSGGAITVCNGSDIIPAGTQRQIFIKVQGTSAGGPSTINGALLFSNGSNCTVPGTLPGDMTADNTSTTSITVVPQACDLAVTTVAGSIACNGGSATLTARVTGASRAVEFSIDGTNFQADSVFTVTAGTYTVTARQVSNPACSATASATITEPAELVAAESHSAILCFGGSSTVTITATGGTAPFTGTGTFQQAAGTQTYTVTDANGCTDQVTVTVSQPAQLVAAVDQTAIACFGGSSTVTITATGGTAPYTGTGTFTRTAGTYTFTVTDANGCSDDVTVTIAQPAELIAASSQSAINCFGGSSTVTISATGGTAPYTGTGTFTRTAGTYTFTVTDARGCTDVVSVTITQPSELVAAASQTSIACFGGSSTVTIAATGGAAPYIGTGTFTRTAGIYTFTVTDANGCTDAVSVTIAQPTQLTASATSTPSTGGADGTATAVATGGTAPYSYLWSPGGQTTATATGLAAGTYTVRVTDANGCTATATTTITAGCGVVVNAGPDQTICNGGAVTLTANVTGGSTSSASGPQPFTEVPGSTADRRIFSGNIDYIAIGNTFSQHEARVNCNKNTTSSKTLSLPAGAVVKKAYLYWSGSGSVDNTVKLNGTNVTAEATKTDNISGVGAFFGARKEVTNLVTASGNYTVSDLTWSNASSYCQWNGAYGAWALVVVYEQASLPGSRVHVNSDKFDMTYPAGTYAATINNISIPANCTPNAKLTIIAFEGDNYKGEELKINNVIDPDKNNFRGQAGPNLDIITKNVPGLASGASSLTYSIRSYQENTIYGNAIEALFDYVKVLKYNSCPAGSCSDYKYEWRRNGSVVGTTKSISVSAPGTYTVKATDCKNCSGSDEVVVSTSTLAAAYTVPAPISCNGGTTSVFVSASGGTAPYTGTGQFTKGAGTHTFTVTDAKGCKSTTTVTLVQPSAVTVTATAPQIPCGGSTATITVSASGGTPPYFGTGTFPRAAGTYTFSVSDAKGCTKTVSVTVTAASCGPVDPDKCYKLIVKHSGKAAGVENSSSSNGARIEQRSYTGGSNQIWKFEKAEANFYKVINVNSGKVLDVANSSNADGASIQQWSYGNGNNQKWSLASAGNGYYNIKAKHSNKAMAVQSSSNSNGAKVEQRGTGGSDNAKWAIQEVGCPGWTRHPIWTKGGETATAEKEELVAELDVTAMPNPSTTDFTLVIKSNDQSTPVVVRMLDANGKLISTSEKSANSTFRILGDKLSAGYYFAEVTQGGQRKIVKLIKVN